MKSYLLTTLLLINAFYSKSQNSYFQQEVNYKIDVRLDDKEHFLHAFEELEYVNNSGQTLNYIFFHLWPNAYKTNQTAFAKQQVEAGSQRFYFTSDKYRGYIDSLDFKVNGVPVEIEENSENPDIIKLILNEPLTGGAKIDITTPFRVKIPWSYSRLGRINQQYQITQWYPKPAVFDKDGWHTMPYLDMGEFYSEFGSFDVSITVPENYVIGATGDLQNQRELEFLDSLGSNNKNMVEDNDLRKDHPESSSKTKTLRYLQDRVHDFAWFADKRYLVKTGEVSLPGSGRKVKLYAMYNKVNAEVWEDIIEYMHDGIQFYSKTVGEYPYDVATVVDGALSAGSGMEYPTITVLGADSEILLELVTVHELGHNWFYGILASNEREFTWMDEGFNSFVEQDYFLEKYPDRGLLGTDPNNHATIGGRIARFFNVSTTPIDQLYPIAYKAVTAAGKDQAMQTHAADFTSINYGIINYQKTATLLRYLQGYLGKDLFQKCMKTYYDEWKFKHPKPDDAKRVFEEVSKQDLSWFFEDFVKTTGGVEYKAKKVSKTGDGYGLVIQNVGEIASPVEIATVKDGEILDSKWYPGFVGKQTLSIKTSENIGSLLIDPYLRMPDINAHNNEIKTKGITKKGQPLKLKLLGSVDYPDKNTIYWLPTIGLNTNDDFLLGAAFYNSIIPEKKFRYIVMPMYSFGLNKHAGLHDIAYSWKTQSFQRVEWGAQFKEFAGYQKYMTDLTFELRPDNPRTDADQTITISQSYIESDQDILPYYEESDYFTSVEYYRNKSDALKRISVLVGITSNIQDFTVIQSSYRWSKTYKRNHKFNLRLYAGAFIQANDLAPIYQLNFSGNPDYQMNDQFFDRAQSSNDLAVLTKQTNLGQGGFRGFIPESSDVGIATVNFDIDVPKLKLFELFVDGGVDFDGFDSFYSTGISLNFSDIFLLHFPLIGDSYQEVTPGSFNEFTDNIRFTLRLDPLNPYKLIRNTY
ncbi:MAG: M1 family metallopeptidase [bacterium]|nr:M1 family metallopeptidase [bacterium]